MNRALPAIVALLVASPAFSQSVNINFGTPGAGPSSTYAAAGIAGEWNTFEAMPAGERFPLVGLDGQPLAVDIRQIGGDFILSEDDPGTSGDDERLLDQMYWTFDNGPDLCLWIDNLENGDYEVLIYAMTPNDPTLISEVRVDNPPDEATVGGAWPGQHVEGITYHRFSQTVTSGEIGLHAGLPGDPIRSGINGIQITPATTGLGSSDPAPPAVTTLMRAYPNPARFDQTIELHISEGHRPGALDVVDVLGRLVWRQPLAAFAPGVHQVAWNGTDLTGRRVRASVYFARLPAAVGGEASRPVKLIRVE